MNTHSIDLIRYCARSRGNSTIYLGTAGSHGNEQLQVTLGKGWEGLTVQVVFHPCKVAVQLPANGVLDVPWEATARPLTALQGRIVFQGFDQDRLVNSTDLAYTVASHSPALGRDEQPYTPGIVEGVLNQMAADKDAILQAAQQTGQAKEAAAASAAAAASSAANAQQSAGAANTSAGQAAESASQAAGSAAAANETLTQVQTAGQEAQQKVKDAETEALGNISAAAPALPAVSAAAAWQSVTVKPDGTGYNLASMAPIEATIRPTVTGNPAVCKDSAAWAFQGLKIYGKSTQDGTPSPENPVPIVSAGDGGEIDVTVNGVNLWDGGEFNVLVGNSSSGYCVVPQSLVDCIKSLPVGTYTADYTSDGNGTIGRDFGKIRIDGPDGMLINVTKTFTLTDSIKNQMNLVALFGYLNQTQTIKKFMLNVGSEVLPYESYKSQSLTIPTPNGLPGIPVDSGGNYTDVSGQQWVCDYKDYARGVYVQRVGKLTENDFSISSILPESSGTRFVNIDSGIMTSVHFPKVFCNRCNQQNVSSYGTEGEYISTSEAEAGRIHIRTTHNDWNTNDFRLNNTGLEIYYPLANPVETPLSEEEIAAYKALHTYDGATVVSTAEDVAGLEVRYVADAQKYIDDRLTAAESHIQEIAAAQLNAQTGG